MHGRAAVVHEDRHASGRNTHRLRGDAVLGQGQAQRRRSTATGAGSPQPAQARSAVTTAATSAREGRAGIAGGFFRMMRDRMAPPKKSILLPLLALALALPLAACGEQSIEVPGLEPPARRRRAVPAALRGLPHASALRRPRARPPNVRTRERTDGPNFDSRSECVERVLYAIENGGFSGAIMPQNIVVGEQARRSPSSSRSTPAPTATPRGRRQRQQSQRLPLHEHAVATRPRSCQPGARPQADPQGPRRRARGARAPRDAEAAAIDRLLELDERWRELTTAAGDAAGRAERDERDRCAARRATSSASRCARSPSAAARWRDAQAGVAQERDALLRRCRTCRPRTPRREDTVAARGRRGRQDRQGPPRARRRADRHGARRAPVGLALRLPEGRPRRCSSSRSCATRWRSSPARASSR